MIRSTFAGFNMAQLAMTANQRALDVAGQNLSNINTKGYTRQRLDLASISPVGAGFSSSSFDAKVGQGVQMTGIGQIRDPFLDIQYRNQLPKVGTMDAMQGILSDIGAIFDETDKTAISAALDKLVSQLTNMATVDNAGTSSADMLVRSASEVLISIIHQNGTDIKNIQSELESKLETSVMPDINNYLKQIAQLNQSIKNSQVLGNPALELQDQRNEMIDALSTYLPIDVKYTTQKLGGGINVDVLDISFTDTDGNKHSLVSDGKAGSFAVDIPGTGQNADLKLTDTDGAVTDISDKMANGVLKGDMDMLNKSEVFDAVGGADATDTKGIGYYGKTFDMVVNKFATMMNEMNAGVADDGTPIPRPLFTTTDGSTTFTAQNIKVSDEWMNGTVSVTISKDADAGSTGYENVLKMINALTTDKLEFKNPATGEVVYEGTLLESYNQIQNTQSVEQSAVESILQNHQTVLNDIANGKDSVSGVYMDEEVMGLMRYKQSYNAAARLMTTMDEMLEKLISGTGVVGR